MWGRYSKRPLYQNEHSSSDRYNAYDIAIIVNNLQQNALEACERMTSGERYISVSGSRKNRFFIISVKNSFEGEVVFDKSTNLPVSTKAPESSGGPAPFHGIGLSNVRLEAAKYLGNVDIKVKKNEFSVTVLLQERKKKRVQEEAKDAWMDAAKEVNANL